MRISQITWCTMPGLSLPAASLSTGCRLPARRVRHSACKHLIYIVLWSIQRGILRAESIFLPALREGSCRRGRDGFHPAACDRRVFAAVFGAAFASLSAVTPAPTGL